MALAISACLLTLSGCVSRQQASFAAARSLLTGNADVDRAVLRRDLRYLRVTVDGRALLMVLGYVDPEPHSGLPVEVWYSAEGDVLRLQSGRLVGLAGGPVERRNVAIIGAPRNWRDLPRQNGRYVRRYDQMPGYLWERQEELHARDVAAPSASQLVGLDPEQLTWIQESRQSRNGMGDDVPAARYAIAPDANEPLYGEECLTRSYCLSWQHWPAAGRPSSK